MDDNFDELIMEIDNERLKRSIKYIIDSKDRLEKISIGGKKTLWLYYRFNDGVDRRIKLDEGNMEIITEIVEKLQALLKSSTNKKEKVSETEIVSETEPEKEKDTDVDVKLDNSVTTDYNKYAEKKEEKEKKAQEQKEVDEEDLKFMKQVFNKVNDPRKPIFSNEIEFNAKFHRLILKIGQAVFVRILPQIANLNEKMFENPEEFAEWLRSNIATPAELVQIKHKLAEYEVKFEKAKELLYRYEDKINADKDKVEKFDIYNRYVSMLPYILCDNCKNSLNSLSMYATATHPNIDALLGGLRYGKI